MQKITFQIIWERKMDKNHLKLFSEIIVLSDFKILDTVHGVAL